MRIRFCKQKYPFHQHKLIKITIHAIYVFREVYFKTF